MGRSKLILPILVILTIVFQPILYAQDRTIADYTKAIEESPDDMKYRFLNYRGKAYLNQGDINSAIMDFSQSISLNPTREAYTLRGKIYFEKERYTPAINDFTKAIEINPTQELFELRGKSYLAQKMYAEAIEDGTRLIELAPDYSESFNLRMEAYAKAEKNDLAIDDIKTAIQLDNNNAFAHEIRKKYFLHEQIVMKGATPEELEHYYKVKALNDKKIAQSYARIEARRQAEIHERQARQAAIYEMMRQNSNAAAAKGKRMREELNRELAAANEKRETEEQSRRLDKLERAEKRRQRYQQWKSNNPTKTDRYEGGNLFP